MAGEVLGPEVGPLPGTVDGPGLGAVSVGVGTGPVGGPLCGGVTGTQMGGGGGQGAGTTGGWEPQEPPPRSFSTAPGATSVPQTRTGTPPGTPTPLPEPMPPELVVVMTAVDVVPAEQIAPASVSLTATPSTALPQARTGTSIGAEAVSPEPMPAELEVTLTEWEPPVSGAAASEPGSSPHRAGVLGSLSVSAPATAVLPQISTGVLTGAWTVSPATMPPEWIDAPAA